VKQKIAQKGENRQGNTKKTHQNKKSKQYIWKEVEQKYQIGKISRRKEIKSDSANNPSLSHAENEKSSWREIIHLLMQSFHLSMDTFRDGPVPKLPSILIHYTFFSLFSVKFQAESSWEMERESSTSGVGITSRGY